MNSQDQERAQLPLWADAKGFSGTFPNICWWYVITLDNKRMVGKIGPEGWYELIEHDVDHPGAVVFNTKREADRVSGFFSGTTSAKWPRKLGRR